MGLFKNYIVQSRKEKFQEELFYEHVFSRAMDEADYMLESEILSEAVVTKIGAKAGILRKGVALHDMPLQEKDF